MRRTCLLLACLCSCGCSVMQPQWDDTLGYQQPTSRDQSDSLPSYKDCPACYVQEGPFEQKMKRVAKGIEEGVELCVLTPLSYGIVYSAYVLSGFQPLL